MVEPLRTTGSPFLQGVAHWVDARHGWPGARRLDSMRIVAVRHFDDPEATKAPRAAFAKAGIAWPERTSQLESSNGLLAARRHPGEVILVGEAETQLQHLLAEMRPGRNATSLAIDLTHGMGVVELHGTALDEWLAHAVDRTGIPAQGHASRCRLADVAVLLMRPAHARMLLVADRSLFPYLADWLAFAHQGAFPDP